ncbi:MAG: HAMP domain-containing sensor histidine kinase [Rhizobacter sp.]
MRRFLLCWLLGGVWAIVAAVTLWQVVLSGVRRAEALDTRLVQAVSRLPGEVPSDPTAFRVSTMTGEWVAGDHDFAPFPWRDQASALTGPTLYVAHIRGVLVRAAAARRPAEAAGWPHGALVQVALPWHERLPSGREVVLESPLAWVYACAAVVSVVIVSGVTVALRWLDQARAALNDPGADAADYAGPTELRPAVQRMRELHRRQTQWVDEQRRFLADASHQLRTPMAVLRTQLQSAIAGDVPASEVLPQMLHTVDRAAGLANQLLSLTKVEQLKRTGHLAPVDLHAAARDAVMELAPLIGAKRLDFALEGAAPPVPGDAVMLGELLRNLLANAIHHAPPAGRLGVLLRDGAGCVELVVWDEGPGVDEDVRQRLFQPFSAGQGGTGLGLSICRQIAGAMGASVDLYNRIDASGVIGVDAVVAWGQGP